MRMSTATPDHHAAGRQRAPHQLPPGRHGLSRRYVETNQRERILAAVADVVGFQGYVSMSVEDIVVTAGVSRRTFYDSFKSKEEAFLAAYEDIGTQLLARVLPVYHFSASFSVGLIGCLREFLEFCAAHPHYADMCIVEALAAGPEAIARRNALMKRLAEMLRRGAETVPDSNHPPALTAETVIGGIYEVVYARVLAGEAAELPNLLPELAYSAMLPYLGHDRAQRELGRLTATLPR